jgi:uncharacterized membrane protein YphA (DoxX/SURF4 family)
MRSIDIDETPQPWSATFGQTFLRAVVGFVVAGHGAEKLLHLRAFQGELIQLGIPNPEIVAIAVLGAELLAGFGLVIGRWTRVSATIAICDAAAAIIVFAQQQRTLELTLPLESAVLLGAAAFYFVVAGSGLFSADMALRKRARLKALRDDEIWQRPPYVAQDAGGMYDDASDSYDESRPTVLGGHDARRRAFLRATSSRG